MSPSIVLDCVIIFVFAFSLAAGLLLLRAVPDLEQRAKNLTVMLLLPVMLAISVGCLYYMIHNTGGNL